MTNDANKTHRASSRLRAAVALLCTTLLLAPIAHAQAAGEIHADGVHDLFGAHEPLADPLGCTTLAPCLLTEPTPGTKLIPFDETIAYLRGFAGDAIPPVECPSQVCELQPIVLPRLPTMPRVILPWSPPPTPTPPFPVLGAPPVPLPPGTPCWLAGTCTPNPPTTELPPICLTITSGDDCVATTAPRHEGGDPPSGGGEPICPDINQCTPCRLGICDLDPCESIDCSTPQRIIDGAGDGLPEGLCPGETCQVDCGSITACLPRHDSTCYRDLVPNCRTLNALTGFASANAPNAPGEEEFRRCSDAGPDIFEVIDNQPGANYGVVVMKGVLSGAVRVAWNNQIPETKKGVNIYFSTAGVTNNWASEAAITGACGMYVGSVHPADSFSVGVDFGGITTKVIQSSSTSQTVEVRVDIHSKFSINPLALSPFELSFGVSGSHTWGNSLTVEWTSTKVPFYQTY